MLNWISTDSQEKHFLIDAENVVRAQVELEDRLRPEQGDGWEENAVWGVYCPKDIRTFYSVYGLAAAKRKAEFTVSTIGDPFVQPL